jgi:preprotein translocase subunit YajC
MKINESTNVSMPMKTVVSLVAIVAIGTMSYFQIIETQNKHSTRLQLMEADLEKNTEFRIKWPRGLMGSLPADSEQFLLIEDLYKQVAKLQETQEMNMTNKVNIEFLQKQVEKLLADVEKLKDSNREIKYTNGNGH